MSNKIRGYGQSRPVNISVDTPAAGYAKDIKLIPFLISEYGGGVNFAIDVFDSVVEFAKRFRKSDKKYQGFLTFLKYGAPAAMLTGDLVSKYRKYLSIKSGEGSIHNEKEAKVYQLLGIKKGKGDQLYTMRFDLGKDVSYWIFEKPETTSFKIKSFNEYENLGGIGDIWKIESGNIFVTIEYQEKTYIWNFSFNRYDDEFVVNSSDMTTMVKTCHEDTYIMHLKQEIFKEFLNSFDIKNNVLYYMYGLHSRPRHPAKREINQFCIEKFSKEIRKVLVRKKKRGYVFVGVPGVGKSSIIRELEAIIPEYPMIYLPACNFSNAQETRDTFYTLTNIQPCIAILEDIDSFNFKEKSSNLGAFLDEIDDVDKKLNVVFIATVNDTDLVHYSLINRPGRLDQVMMLYPPRTPEEIYHVMSVCYKKQDKSVAKGDFIDFNTIDKNIFELIKKNGFTQADVCEIVEKSLLLNDAIDNAVLNESVNDLIASKEAIRKCNFKNKNPYDMNEPEVEKSVQEGFGRGYVTG